MKAFYLDLYGSSKGKLLPTIFISDYRFMLGYFIILFFFRKKLIKGSEVEWKSSSVTDKLGIDTLSTH